MRGVMLRLLLIFLLLVITRANATNLDAVLPPPFFDGVNGDQPLTLRHAAVHALLTWYDDEAPQGSEPPDKSTDLVGWLAWQKKHNDQKIAMRDRRSVEQKIESGNRPLSGDDITRIKESLLKFYGEMIAPYLSLLD
jgi:hypothetical protein